MVNYDGFMQSAGFEFEKYKLIDMIFVTLQAALLKFGSTSLRDLFSKVSPTFGQQYSNVP